MLENGMFVNRESHDPQCREMPYICCVCGEESNDITEYHNGDDVCEDCKDIYLTRNGFEFVDEFIAKNADGYYNGWFFKNLNEHEILAATKSVHSQYFKFRDEEMQSDKHEFCRESDKFTSFVEKQLR